GSGKASGGMSRLFPDSQKPQSSQDDDPPRSSLFSISDTFRKSYPIFDSEGEQSKGLFHSLAMGGHRRFFYFYDRWICRPLESLDRSFNGGACHTGGRFESHSLPHGESSGRCCIDRSTHRHAVV